MIGAASLVLVSMLLQYIPGQELPFPDTLDTHGANTAAVATFKGTFKSTDRKYLTITVEDGQTMRMYITRRTKFIRGGMPAKASDFHAGENISVDAESDARLNLLAVLVRTVSPPKPPEHKPEQ